MRIGSGGVMLSHYSPYKVAEVFNMLNALFPGRIDLGIGRAPGGDALASSALAWPSQPLNASNYPAQASTLKALLEGNISSTHPWKDLHITPQLNTNAQMWMLGSSANSAKLAGQVGMHLALARFISPEYCTPDIFTAYEQAWLEAGHSDKPNRMLAIGGFCASTQEEAEWLAGTAIYRKMMRGSALQDALLSPEEVQNQRKHFSVSEEAQYIHLLQGYTVGTPDRCKTEIEQLAKSFNTREVAIVTVTHDFSARLNSYRLLAS
jgi:luciferase family oxidoreductase group 1